MQAKVFNKGQVVIPAVLRKKYNIKAGNKVEIIEDNDGIKIVPIKDKKPIASIAGIFSEYTKEKPTEDNINKITEEVFVESFKNEIY